MVDARRLNSASNPSAGTPYPQSNRPPLQKAQGWGTPGTCAVAFIAWNSMIAIMAGETIRKVGHPPDQDQLVAFQRLAIEHHRASEEGDSDTANRCSDEIGELVRKIWQENGKTKGALRGLAELAKSRNPAVAMKAITYTLELYPEVAAELPRLQKEKSIVAIGAEFTLRRWKRGEQHILKELLGL
jgi:hypothetical protein